MNSIIEDSIIVINTVNEKKMEVLNHQFDKLMMEHEEAINQIDEKIMCEHGTEDDLVYLYTKEAEEVKEKGKGILGSIFAAIRKLFKKIKEFLFGKKKEEKQLPETVQLPENPDELVKEGHSICDKLKRFLLGDKDSFKRDILKATATGAAGTVGMYATNKAINKLQDFSSYVDSCMDELQGKSENSNMSPEDQSLFRKGLNKLSNLGRRCSNCISSIFNGNNGNQSSDEGESSSNKKTERLDDGMTLDEMKVRRRAVEEKIVKLELKLQDMTKPTNGVKGFVKRTLLEDKSLADRHKIKQMEELAKKRDRTEKEQKKYKELLAKYGDKKETNDNELDNIKNTIGKLKNIASSLDNAINKAKKSEDKTVKKDVKSAKKMSSADIDKLLANI